jgi:predicted signal transduction protein with EAL and GGDEF domain
LRSCAREVDTIARLGGDEFALILSGSASAEDAERIASRMVETVGVVYELNGHCVSIGLSVGIALAPVYVNAAETLLSRADRALYAAKTSGRGRFCFSDALHETEAAGAAGSAVTPPNAERHARDDVVHPVGPPTAPSGACITTGRTHAACS